MPKEVVPITGLDTVGLIEDVPPVSLPPAAFSDCRNVRFRDGCVQKMEGDVNIMPYIRLDPTDVLRYVAWWPNPNLAFASLGYYLVIVEQLSQTGGLVDNAYLLKVNELGVYTDTGSGQVSLTPQDASFKGSFLPAGNWQHTFFQGGFSIIVNNGLEAPRFILDSEDNTETANVPVFAELPNWASYAADPIYLAALSMMPTEGVDPRTLRTTAGVIRDFGDFLVAGNLIERANIAEVNAQGMFIGIENSAGELYTSAELLDPANANVTLRVIRANTVIRALPGIVRSSDIAAPGAIPQNWNPFATAVNTADEFTITNDGVLQDFVELQGNLYIYSNSSISVMSRTGNVTTPLSVRPVTTAYGTLTTDGVLEFDGKHFVVGAQDIYIFGGHPGSIQSIGDGRVRDAFYNRLNPLSIDNVFLLRYQQKDEIWICYPNKDSTSGLVNDALIWNYRKNNWTKRDLQNVVAGDVAPVPGGGLPLAELIFSGDSGNDSSIALGSVHTVGITASDNILTQSNGIRHEYEIRLGADFPRVPEATLGTPIHSIRFGQNFNSGTVGRELNFTSQGRTFVAADNAGRFLQVPDFDAMGTMLATTRDFNFTTELPAGITSTAATTTGTFATQVTLPVFLALILQDPTNYSWQGVSDYNDNPAIPQYAKEFFNNYTASAEGVANPLPPFDPNAPLTVHLTDQADTFVIQYEAIPGEVLPYSSFIQIGRNSEFFDEASLSAARMVADDQPGQRIVEEQENKNVGEDPFTMMPVSGVANTFYFDLTDLIDRIAGSTGDDLNDLVFFFRGGGTGPNYTPLPANAVVFNPDPFGTDETEEETVATVMGGSVSGNVVDGGDRDLMPAGTAMDGERRINRTFGLNLIQDEPILGSVLLDRLQYTTPAGARLELTETPLQVWVPDGTTEVTEMNLVAYQRPMTTDGDADVTTDAEDRVNIVIEDIDPRLLTNAPPVIEFRGQQQEFQDNTTNIDARWIRGDNFIPMYTTGDFELSVSLAYDSGVESPTFDAAYGAAQRQAFAETIEAAFFNNSAVPLRAISNTLDTATGDWVIRLQSARRIAVQLEVGIQNASQVAMGEATITVDDPFTLPEQTDAHLRITQTVQGKYDYVYDPNAPRLTDQRVVVPPAVQLSYTDPDQITFFDIEPSILPLVRTDRTITTPYPASEWSQIISNRITTASRLPQWSGSYDEGVLSMTTIPVIYDEPLGDAGVDVPDINPVTGLQDYVSFPAERNGVNFNLRYNPGSGWGPTIGTPLPAPVSSITTQGSYPRNNTPSYIALRVSDSSITTVPMLNPQGAGEEVFLFPISNNLDTTAVVTELQAQLDRRAPRLRALVTGSGRLSVQPANYNDLANFVLEFQINNMDSIERIRQLLDAQRFNQNEFNPKPQGDLPERIQVGRTMNTVETNNRRGFIEVAEGMLQIDNAQAPTFEFDVLRPWPKTQINFTLEYPIFAATRPFEDGTTTNKVLGADIGFSRAAFMPTAENRVEVPVPNPAGMSTRVMITGQDAPSSYESFIERVQQGLSPEFNTEILGSVAMWTDGSTQAEFRGPFAYNSVEFRGIVSDSPGDPVDLTNTDLTNLGIRNIQHISEGYKVDTRLTGRFINWRITDATDGSTPTNPGEGKSFNPLTLWRLSGLQFEVGRAGRR